MDNLHVAFVDFWSGFDYSIMTFYHILEKHFDVVIHDDVQEADYVFFSCFGDKHWTVPPTKIKIFITAENISPDFNTCDYAIAFDRLSFGDRYLRFPNIYGPICKRGVLEKVAKKHLPPYPEKTGFCSFVVSNAEADSLRVQLFKRLSLYKKVDSGGRYLNNIDGPVKDKLSFDQKHKFSICCENSSHAGYITEKLYEAFSAQLIPIYWGAPDVGLTFNKKAFIDVSDYDSIDEAIAYIKRVDQDDELYNAILAEPALVDEAEENFEYYYKQLESFLLSIFNQSLFDARRYNRTTAGFFYPNKVAKLMKLSHSPLFRIVGSVKSLSRHLTAVLKRQQWKKKGDGESLT